MMLGYQDIYYLLHDERGPTRKKEEGHMEKMAGVILYNGGYDVEGSSILFLTFEY